jgi:acyl-CoA thioesterase I
MPLLATFQSYGLLRRIAVAILAAHLGMIVASGATAAPIKILALGDSLTSGYGLAASDGFCPQLERALRAAGHDVSVIDAGAGGDTTADGLARLDWSLADKPDVVILELGGNDALRGLDPGQAKANLDAILTRLQSKGLVVLLAGMKAPRNLGPDYAKEFDAIFPELAVRHQVALYPFFLDGVAADPDFNQEDGIHPNPAGVAIIVKRMLPAVERALAQVKPG